MTLVRTVGLAIVMAMMFSVTAVAEIDKARISQSVVRIKVTGKWADNGREVSKVGTGFFIPAAGFLMTAGHIFDPRTSEADGNVQWKNPPLVELEYMEDGRKAKLAASETSLLYVDKQLDLALIGTALHRDGLPLGCGLHLEESQPINIVAFGSGPDNDRQNPDFVAGSVQSSHNFSRRFGGMVDINATGLFESDSGSPVLNIEGQLVGVFVKGRKPSAIGEVAVPIAFAAPLLSMAGIAYPPPASIQELLTESDSKRIKEIEGAIRELKAEIAFYEYKLLENGKHLRVDYTKRLAAGFDPSSIELDITLWSGEEAILQEFVADVEPIANALPVKNGFAMVRNFSAKVQRYLANRARDGRSSFKFKDLEKMNVDPTAVYDWLDNREVPGSTKTIWWTSEK